MKICCVCGCSRSSLVPPVLLIAARSLVNLQVCELLYVCWAFSEHFGGLLKEKNTAVACIGAALVCSYIYVINIFLAPLQLLWIVAPNKQLFLSGLVRSTQMHPKQNRYLLR